MIQILEIDASQTWPLRHKVMWPSKPLDFVILPNDNEGIHYGLFEKEKLISVISLFTNHNEAQFRKFATDIDFQRKGYGAKLLMFLIKETQKLKVNRLICSARTRAVGFYEKFGLKVYSDLILKNEKEYVMMELVFD